MKNPFTQPTPKRKPGTYISAGSPKYTTGFSNERVFDSEDGDHRDRPLPFDSSSLFAHESHIR